MADNTLDYAGPIDPDPRQAAVARGYRYGRYSLLCAAALLPCIFVSVLFLFPMTAGFGYGLGALVLTRGRSVPAWIGVAIHGGLASAYLWIYFFVF